MKQINYFQTKMKGVSEKGATLTINGYASTKDVDRGGDRVLPEAFTETVRDRASKSPVPMLLGHDHEKVIGDWPVMTIDANGLLVEGEVKFDTDECIAKIKDGALRGLSIGYRVEEWEVENGQGVVIYNSTSGLVAGYDVDDMWNNESVRVIKKIDLVEISVVATPMNPFAFISSVKKFFDMEKKDLLASLKGEPGEAETPDTPDESNNQETVVENQAGESPAPAEDTPTETPASDNPDIVKGDEEPTDTPNEETQKGISEEEVKALIASAVSEAVKGLNEEIASLKQSLADDTLSKSYETLKKDFDELNKTLSQEVFPERKMFGSRAHRPLTYADLGMA